MIENKFKELTDLLSQADLTISNEDKDRVSRELAQTIKDSIIGAFGEISKDHIHLEIMKKLGLIEKTRLTQKSFELYLIFDKRKAYFIPEIPNELDIEGLKEAVKDYDEIVYIDWEGFKKRNGLKDFRDEK